MIANLMSSGEFPLGLVYAHRVEEMKSKGMNTIEWVALEPIVATPIVIGIAKNAPSPNAAKLFMNWRLSKEGQAFAITKLGNITSLKEPPAFPKGWDPKVIKVWVPNFEQFEKLRDPWLEEWNKTYGYRQ